MRLRLVKYLMCVIAIGIYSCHSNSPKKPVYVTYKGVYSFGPEQKTFTDCDNGHEFWVTDNSRQLELKYSQLNFERPYQPVYIEVEGLKIHSGKDGISSEYDSTLVVKKLIKITKDIPQDLCN